MFSRKSRQANAALRMDRVMDDLPTQHHRGKRSKPFFPSLTKFLLILGLGFLSWLATYTGMLELILANTGAIDFSVRVAIGFAVAMLMLMIIYLLDSLFSPIKWWLRCLYLVGYVFLTLISVGFGFGFYWKFLEARSEATRSAESAVTQVQTALQGGQTRLEQLETTLVSLTALSTQKAEEERTKGQTCPKSPPGDGPRRRLRDADAKNFQFAGNFVKKRAGTVKNDISALNTDLAKISSGDKTTVDPKTGTRNAFLRALSHKLDLTITRFNAFRTDPQLRLFRDNFSSRSSQTVFDNGRGGKFRCPDPQLQAALRGVVKAIDGLPELEKPKIAAVEGSEAIVEAFRRLVTTTAGVITLKLPPTPDELRTLQQKAVQSVRSGAPRNPALHRQAGLGERDYIPLFVAIFVDFCILLVSVNRPVNRLQNIVHAARNARGAQMHEVLDRFHEVHEGGRSQRLDVFHEVMFDAGGDQYVAVPLDLRDKSADQADEEHDRKFMQIRYLSTLLVALEEAGLVSRSVLIGERAARKNLKKLGSRFADAPSFRVYRFTKGAWSAIVLDDIIGASSKLQAEKIAEMRRRSLQPVLSLTAQDMTTSNDLYQRSAEDGVNRRSFTDLKVSSEHDERRQEPYFENNIKQPVTTDEDPAPSPPPLKNAEDRLHGQNSENLEVNTSLLATPPPLPEERTDIRKEESKEKGDNVVITLFNEMNDNDQLHSAHDNRLNNDPPELPHSSNEIPNQGLITALTEVIHDIALKPNDDAEMQSAEVGKNPVRHAKIVDHHPGGVFEMEATSYEERENWDQAHKQGWREQHDAQLLAELSEPSWSQPEINIEKIARTFAAKGAANDKTKD